MEMDEVSNNIADTAPSYYKAVIHSPTDAPLCEACRKLDKSFFDVKCTGCQLLLHDEDTTVSELFAIIRQWIPLTQQNILMLIQRVRWHCPSGSYAKLQCAL